MSAPTLCRAYVETSNFVFEAFGESENQARAMLRKGWRRHVAQTGADPDLLNRYADDVRIDWLESGVCYRDATRLEPPLETSAPTRTDGKIYIGKPDGSVLVLDADKHVKLDPRFDLRNHSPTGFAWGYHGSGPAQLALALIADATGDDALACKWYQSFKVDKVSRMPAAWRLPAAEVIAWVRELEGKPEATT